MLNNKFREIYSTIENDYVRNFKKNGGKVIGYCYSRVPVAEVYHAAGILGIRLRANEITATTLGDAYFGPVVCSFPKSLLQMAGEEKYRFLDGAVTSSVCDTMRRLDECWRKAAREGEAVIPPFFKYFAVPHKSYDFSLEWFSEELRLHIRELEAHFGVRVTKEALNDSIRLYNHGRRLLKKLDEIRSRPDVPISGADALSVFVAAVSMPMEQFVEMAEALLAELEQSDRPVPGKRLFIVGSVNDDRGLIDSIEQTGAVVVGDMMSFGSKYYDNMIAEDSDDPVDEIAKSYLLSLKHPRMFGRFRERSDYLADKVKQARAQGVIFQNIRFCDLHGCENSLYAEDLTAMGIPCLRLEREYGPLVETERVKMRAQAFVERI
ncbi:MAG: 2-hydroxyacyl-CoA dehydratase family protein [Thermodesulfobacteriota bacterium]